MTEREWLIDRLTLALMHVRIAHKDAILLPSYAYIRDCLRRDTDYEDTKRTVELLVKRLQSDKANAGT